jgi:hypothetical protein
VWDEAHHIEHFIREARFLTDDVNIGFLVPTPQAPELAEADHRIFDLVSSLGKPTKVAPTVDHSPWSLVSPLVMSSFLQLGRLSPAALFSGMNDLKSQPTRSSVLKESDVAGYHATILSADDEQALAQWLSVNGYTATPELKSWLEPYIVGKWKITAFKLIKRDDDAPILITRAIRLSFHTDRPFYPYSEPSDRQLAASASPGGRALTVAILSENRMAGVLANNSRWPAKLQYAGDSAGSTPSREVSNKWLQYAGLSETNGPIPNKLTSFVDESNPRPGTADLYFTPDPVQTSFQGEAIDLNLPPRDRLVFNRSSADYAALLVLLILPSIPLYCGWKVLNQWPDDDKSPFSSRRIAGLPSRPQIGTPKKLYSRLLEGALGFFAIGLGLFYGLQFILIFLTEIASALLRWSDVSGNGAWAFAAIILAAIPAVLMSWGIIFCGVNVLRLRAIGLPLRRTNIFYGEGAWQGFMGASSLVAGCIASVAVLGVIVSLLSL